jgi:hypothetical protein
MDATGPGMSPPILAKIRHPPQGKLACFTDYRLLITDYRLLITITDYDYRTVHALRPGARFPRRPLALVNLFTSAMHKHTIYVLPPTLQVVRGENAPGKITESIGKFPSLCNC